MTDPHRTRPSKAPQHSSQSPQKRAFRALSVEQENALDLLLTGATDQAVGEAVGVNRMTVWHWQHEHPPFMATLAKRRQALYSAPLYRLRSAAKQAADTLINAIAEGNLKASVELLKGLGLLTGQLPVNEIVDPGYLMQLMIEAKVEQTKASGGDVLEMLIEEDAHPGIAATREQIERALWEEYGEP